MRQSFDDVPVFVAAVEAGSFARAAERLSLSRSAVGKAIARLEDRLGVRLFVRSTRSSILTEEGQLYFERCQRAIGELRAAEVMLESGRHEVVGRLKVSVPIIFGRKKIAPLLLDLAERYPALELDLRFSDAVVDIVGDRFDIAIRNGGTTAGAGLSTRRIATQTKIVCASPAYLQQRGTPQTIGDLAEHDALVYWRGDQLYEWAFNDASAQPQVAALKWRLQFDSQDAIVDAARRGLGVALMPDWLVEDQILDGSLVRLLPDAIAPPLQTYAIWPTMLHMPPRLRVALDHLANNLMGN